MNKLHKVQKDMNMQEKFKAFLEEHFRKIAPTQAAMEYRKALLRQLLDREQELRIKGINDDELIFNMAVSELGNIDEVLHEFENRQIKSGEVKRKISGVGISAIAIIALLTVVYLIIGGVVGIWSPTWLIMVGGAFVSIGIVLAYIGVKFVKKHKLWVSRICVAIGEVLLSVFVFLLLQLVFKINGAWMTFLAMVVLVIGTDTAIAFITNSKIKWFELPVFIELLGVMLYVILGLNVPAFWHPGWLMCLAGVVCALVQIIVVTVKKVRAQNKKEGKESYDKNVREDEAYWTKWDD